MAGNNLAIVENIRLQLKDINQLAQELDLVGQRITGYSGAVSWEPFVKHEIKETVDFGEEFVRLLSVWVKMQRENSDGISPEREGKSTKMLLAERFGTEVLSQAIVRIGGEHVRGCHRKDDFRMAAGRECGGDCL